jgi:hypothetical protein
MRICESCKGKIPKHIWVDGKKRYTSVHRKFCFECSPFGSHNTKSAKALNEDKDFDENGNRLYDVRVCPECGKKHRKRGYVCQTCVFNKKLKKTIDKVKGITGDSCWICGYNKTFRGLAFHHLDRDLKDFGLSSRELAGYAWSRVEAELKKCVLVCHNCHVEIHEDLIKEEEVNRIWKNKWS